MSAPRLRRSAPFRRRQEKGAVLFVGLITLLVLTIIGLHAARASQMTIIAATNAQESAIALALAERSVGEGERALITLFGTSEPGDLSVNAVDGYYDEGDVSLDTLNWDQASGIERVFDGSGVLIAEFVVEYLGEGLGPGTSLSPGASASPAHLYRISGRGVGARGSSRIVQTIFSTQT